MRADALTVVRELVCFVFAWFVLRSMAVNCHLWVSHSLPSFSQGAHEEEVHIGFDTESGRDDDHEHLQLDSIFSRSGNQEGGAPSSLTDAHDYAKLSRGLQKRADLLTKAEGTLPDAMNDTQDLVDDEDSDSLHQFENVFLDPEAERGSSMDSKDRRLSLARRRSSRARFANKVLGRLYSRRAFTGGLVFSRGHFLGDVSKMVAGLLSADFVDEFQDDDEGSVPKYGFGEKTEGGGLRASNSQLDSVSEMVIHEQEGDELIVHSSTLTAGKEGCVVLVFPKASLIPFLDEYPGLLLSLLGTQVVV